MNKSASQSAATQEFERLVDLHYHSLYRFGFSLAGNDATAADLVQQTFFRFATKGAQLHDRSKAKSWLFTTLHREFLQLARRDWRSAPLEAPDALAEEPLSDATVIADALDTEALYLALAEVEDDFRAPLSLFYLEGLSYAEISETLDIPVGTVMSRLSRGRARLKERLLARLSREKNLIPFHKANEARHG